MNFQSRASNSGSLHCARSSNSGLMVLDLRRHLHVITAEVLEILHVVNAWHERRAEFQSLHFGSYYTPIL